MRRAADVLLALLAVSIPLSTTGMEIGVAGLGALTVAAAARGWPVVRRTPLVGGLTQYTFGDAEVVIAMWAALAVLMRSADAAAGAG